MDRNIINTWRILALLSIWIVAVQSGWGQYYRFEFVGNTHCSDPIILQTYGGINIEVKGSADVPVVSQDGSEDIVGVTVCNNGYGSPTTYGDCWSVAGLFRIYPVITDILKNNAIDRFLPTKEKVSIGSQYTLFPVSGSFNWYYSLNGIDNWKPLATNTTAGISVSASDIFPIDEVDLHLNETVFFRVKYNCDCQDNLYSDPEKYQIVPSSPTLTPEVTPPTCSYQTNGKVKFTLSRAFKEGETLIFNLNDQYGNPASNVPTTISNIDDHNSFEISGLSGIYSLMYQSSYEIKGQPNPYKGTLRTISLIDVKNLQS